VIHRLLRQLDEVASELGYSLDRFVEEKITEARARRFLTLLPAGHLSQGQVPSYLAALLGREPYEAERELVTMSQRRVRISESQRIDLERRQSDRCSVCGRFLDRASNPHVDHRVPIALGGTDDFANFQLLCAPCNLGKGKLPTWHLGVPYLETRLTRRLRYCVLSRANGRCQHPGCEMTTRTSELRPALKIPAIMGGAFRFDNLVALCVEHETEYIARRTTHVRARLRRSQQGQGSRAAPVRRR